MSIYILKKEHQVKGAFDNGAIIENKPIGFPQESGVQKPYSNLFYWANAASERGGLIDIHPHQGFEILSFVIEGEIVHYDTKLKQWLKLRAGDVQIIRAGNGISHAEKFEPGGRIFQIWFDPDLHKSLMKPASYNDYRDKEFPTHRQQNYSIKFYKGEGAPINMDSEGVEIFQYEIEPGLHTIAIDNNFIYSSYLISGKLLINDEIDVAEDDFVKIESENIIKIQSGSTSKFFVIKHPARLSYKTYFEDWD